MYKSKKKRRLYTIIIVISTIALILGSFLPYLAYIFV
jgi:hypothetical protein